MSTRHIGTELGGLSGEQVSQVHKVMQARIKCDPDSFWNGEYDLPWKTIAAIAAALLYFINPIDLIPDFIPVAGYLDDAGVILACVSFIREDLEAYACEKGLDLKEHGLE